MVILVNEMDEVLGHMDKLEAHRKGILHRAISLFIFNNKGEWLLQQRAAHKYHSGLLWSNATCTHPIFGEAAVDAAHRRLKEEMGLSTSLKKSFIFQYRAELTNGLIENELDHIFIGQCDDSPVINKEEVASYRYISSPNLVKEITNQPEQFTVWFKLLFERVLNKM